MKNIFDKISKTEMASILAIIIALSTFSLSFITLFHKPADKDLALLINSQAYGLMGFVAGYFYNKNANKTLK